MFIAEIQRIQRAGSHWVEIKSATRMDYTTKFVKMLAELRSIDRPPVERRTRNATLRFPRKLFRFFPAERSAYTGYGVAIHSQPRIIYYIGDSRPPRSCLIRPNRERPPDLFQFIRSTV